MSNKIEEFNNSNELYQLFTDDTPLLDVRAPVEFEQGAFPCASNIPLLDDQQRHEIGLKYKQAGQDEAIALGIQLISGDIKEERLKNWSDFIQANPSAKLYCFRGGLRSRTTQQWLHEHGLDIALIQGGYKRMRRYLIDSIDDFVANNQLIILAGKTGTGKTECLLKYNNGIDLEGLANHRGSSFGHYVTPQPSQIDFENNLAIDYLKKKNQGIKQFLLEDEGRLVGKRVLPDILYHQMKQADLVLLERPIAERIEITLNDYIISNYQDFIKVHGEKGQQLFSDYLLDSLARVQKRLGGKNYKIIKAMMEHALIEQLNTGDIDLHRQWIKSLMIDYYDPMYEYQLEKKQQRIVFQGDASAIEQWLSHLKT